MITKNIKLITKCISTFGLLLLTIHVNGQNDYSATVQEKIHEVENNLSPAVKITGEKPRNILERMEHHQVKGVSIAVIDNYEIQWAKAYGLADGKKKTATTVHTKFQAASISKSLNAMAILQMVEQGKIDLNIDINSILKTWKFPYNEKSNGKTINTMQLLSHTAGLSTSGFDGYTSAKKLPSLTQILDGKKPANSDPVRSIAEPGQAFQYSGGGTLITQLMLEECSGLSYEDYIRQHILNPLNMQNSFYALSKKTKSAELASGHWYGGERLKRKYHIYPELAAAGLWTTPTDLAKFVVAIQKTISGQPVNILSKEKTLQMLQPVLEGQPNAIGTFIIDKSGSKYFHHAGSNEGFTCHYMGSLQGGKGIVVMTNSEAYSIIAEIINSVAQVYEWENYYNPTPRTIADVETSDLMPLTGIYEFESGKKLTIAADRNILYLSSATTRRLDLIPESTRSFFMKNIDEQIEFVEKDGAIQLNLLKNGKVYKAVKSK